MEKGSTFEIKIEELEVIGEEEVEEFSESTSTG